MKRFFLGYIGIAVSMFFFVTSCSLDNDCKDCVNPPSSILIKIVDASNSQENLISDNIYNSDSIKIWYAEKDGNKTKVDFNLISTGWVQNVIETNIAVCSEIGEFSNFYVYLNQSDTDTITIKVIKHSDGCCTSFPLDSIAVNGKSAEWDTSDYSLLLKKNVEKD
ncbi:MAG: hypothetical protein H6537_02280 [Bacteroidales bacterium]|nr:hypothetical protein [Bacteroidales bacterium]HPD95723.1 hypothetical protein [Tenuifilaceae bacterium]HRX31599.1 hypothetical protein [Tenuifilaceae bacterium]